MPHINPLLNVNTYPRGMPNTIAKHWGANISKDATNQSNIWLPSTSFSIRYQVLVVVLQVTHIHPIQVSCWNSVLLPSVLLMLFFSLSLTLSIFLCVCMRVCAQSGQQGFAVAWSSLATKGCQGSLTYLSKPKMCGRFHGSHYNS